MKKITKQISGIIQIIAAGFLFEISMQQASAGSQIWSDEFNGAEGSHPNSANWNYETGGGGWGNNELEIYTNSTANSYITSDSTASDGKCLQIKCTTSNGQWNGQWYSARLDSYGKAVLTPGHAVGFSARCPQSGPGYWPACWMLGTVGGTWPANGEIDVLEQINGQNTIHQSLHMPGWDPTVAINVANANAYNKCSSGWASDGSYIKFWINDNATATFTRAGKPGGAVWEFNTNNQFYMLLNVAMGGNWPGNPTAATAPGHGMRVDWVRMSNYP